MLRGRDYRTFIHWYGCIFCTHKLLKGPLDAFYLGKIILLLPPSMEKIPDKHEKKNQVLETNNIVFF